MYIGKLKLKFSLKTLLKSKLCTCMNVWGKNILHCVIILYLTVSQNCSREGVWGIYFYIQAYLYIHIYVYTCICCQLWVNDIYVCIHKCIYVYEKASIGPMYLINSLPKLSNLFNCALIYIRVWLIVRFGIEIWKFKNESATKK